MAIIKTSKTVLEGNRARSTKARSLDSTASRAYLQSTQTMASLLGQRIRITRLRRRWSETEAAERARIARATLQKIERGEPSVAIGLVLELCSVVGLGLFGSGSPAETADQLDRARLELLALPRRIRARPSQPVDDDF